jgi:branched-chain amino acid transport system substrate-binding protein
MPRSKCSPAASKRPSSADDSQAAAADALKDRRADQATAIGKVTYGETGDLTSPSFSLYKWEDGKIVAAQ